MAYELPRIVVAGDKPNANDQNVIVNDIIDQQSNIQALSATVSTIVSSSFTNKLVDTRIFNTVGSSTYKLPQTSRLVIVEAIGAGGGGGSGGSNPFDTNGGSGGAGGTLWRTIVSVSSLGGAGSNVNVVIGAGGIGAVGGMNSDGNIGGTGGDSSFGNLFFPGSPGGWRGGANLTGYRQRTWSRSYEVPGYGLSVVEGSEYSYGGRGISTSLTSVNEGGPGFGGGGGGGGGGGRTDATIFTAGSDGGVSRNDPFSNSSTGGGGSGAAINTSASNATVPKSGGGGGGASSTNGGNGGNGANPGGGGGGGGACGSAFTSGAGGNGGNAQIQIWVFG
jgi:hypothetical protein